MIRSSSWKSNHVCGYYMVIHKLSRLLKMANPVKTWFFELIEDAIGSKAMKKFYKEEEENNTKSNKKLDKN